MWRNDIYHRNGIYGIKNKVTEEVYIGKTTINFGDRWDCHKSQLRGNYHDNKNLQNAWNKYGEENFEFIVLHDLLPEDDINELEKYYIEIYRNKNLAYNIHNGGDNGWPGMQISENAKRIIGSKNKEHMIGHKASEETRKKMSESQKKKKKNTIETVKEVRRLYEEEHLSTGEIAKIMDMLKGTVCSIVSYRTWKNV